MIRVAIVGAAGRMGRSLVSALSEQKDQAKAQLQLAAAWVAPQSKHLGQDSGSISCGEANGVEYRLAGTDQQIDCIIDFSSPENTLETLKVAQQLRTALVIGTTGFDDQQRAQIKEAGEELAIVLAANMSVGVNVCLHLIQQAARAMGEQVDIEISETHHRNKKDAPSGTAIEMGKLIAKTMNWDFEQSAVYSRQGLGEAREAGKIGFASVRAGDVVGDHTVLFASEGERLEITHKASNRKIYAEGALRAATWLHSKQHGLFDMRDVLGLST